MLHWFLENLRKHYEGEVVIADFGMTKATLSKLEKENIISIDEADGWFKKPLAMMKASSGGGRWTDGEKSNNIVWMDTDCEVVGNIDKLFDYIEPEMLAMCIDNPMNRIAPTETLWYNSGVVGFMGMPAVLTKWATACRTPTERGDQEELHKMMPNRMVQARYIRPVPSMFNTLRIDIRDGLISSNSVVHHWTGPKGKQIIIGKINRKLRKD